MVAPKHGTLAVNGVRLHFVEQGGGAPILFLHGFPEYWGAWRRVMEELGDQFRSVAIDTRGINLSERPARPHGYDMRELVKDVRQAVAALGYEKVTLVGHDWGGFIAWETAIRHPEILEGLVIINTAHTGIFDRELRKDGAQAAASKYMLAFRSSRGEELVSRNDFAGFRREIIDPHLASGMMTKEEAAEYLAVWQNAKSLTAGLDYYRANKSGPPSGDDPEPRHVLDTVVRVPTLVIWGDKDVYFTPDNVDLMREVVPNLTVHRFAENNHWIVHQKPKEVAALIAKFTLGNRLSGVHSESSPTPTQIKRKAIDEAEFSSVAAEALRTYDQDFQTFFLAKLLDVEIAFGVDTCTVTIPVRDFLRNPQGTLHGGIIATLFDISMGHLLKHASGDAGTTLEMKVQYLKPARTGSVTCEARFNKQGRTISYLEAKMFDATGIPVAVATSTWQRLSPRDANRS